MTDYLRDDLEGCRPYADDEPAEPATSHWPPLDLYADEFTYPFHPLSDWDTQ